MASSIGGLPWPAQKEKAASIKLHAAAFWKPALAFGERGLLKAAFRQAKNLGLAQAPASQKSQPGQPASPPDCRPPLDGRRQ
jgi:hypothetical protein